MIAPDHATDGSSDRLQAILALASGRRRRRGSRSAGATATRQDCGVKLMRKLLKKHGFAPDVLVTDKLRSYAAAKSELRLTARHEACGETIGPRIRTWRNSLFSTSESVAVYRPYDQSESLAYLFARPLLGSLQRLDASDPQQGRRVALHPAKSCMRGVEFLRRLCRQSIPSSAFPFRARIQLAFAKRPNHARTTRSMRRT